MLKKIKEFFRNLLFAFPKEGPDPLDAIHTPLEDCVKTQVEDVTHGAPYELSEKNEKILTDSLVVLPTDEVSVLKMEVWGEGKNKCKGHHWHKVKTSRNHLIRVVEILGIGILHEDFVCCRCTFGMCKISKDEHPK